MDLDQLEHDYQKALRAWHVAWQAPVDWLREHFHPLDDREQSVVHEEVLAVRQKLRDTEERAYDRFLRARAVPAGSSPGAWRAKRGSAIVLHVMVAETDWAGLVEARSASAEHVAERVLPQKPQGGGSHPVLVRADDGNRYWLKALNNPQGSRVLVNEQVVTRCGVLIGAPVRPVALLRVHEDLAGFEFTPGRQLEEGIAHGSLNLDNATFSKSLDHRAADENPVRHPGIFALSDWLWGSDHQWLYDLGGEWRTHSHDHGHYFPGGPNWTQDSLRQHFDQPHPLGLDPAGLAPGAAVELADRLDGVTRDEIAEVLNHIPDSWPVASDELETLGWFLEQRREGVAARLRAL